MEIQKTGFIGLGNIGKSMAKRQLGSRFQLHVHDVFAEPVAELVEGGATAASPAEMAQNCDLISICVRDNTDVEGLLYGDEGILANVTAGTVIAIHSTVTQEGLLKWVSDCAAKHATLIDAPMTGGNHGAEAGELVYMLGGEEDVVADISPVLDLSSKKIIHAGAAGAGIALKLCINLMTFASFIAVKEAKTLAKAAGLSPDVLYEVGQANGVIGDFNLRFVQGHDALFSSMDEESARPFMEPNGKLGEKDLAAALATAEQLGLELPFTRNNQSIILDTFIKA